MPRFHTMLLHALPIPGSHTTSTTAPRLLLRCPPPPQVPHCLHDRSTFAFAAALTIDLLNVLFEQRATRLDLLLLPAFIKVLGLGLAARSLSGLGLAAAVAGCSPPSCCT